MKTKTFTVVITSPYEDEVNETKLKRMLDNALASWFHPAAVQVHEVNKTFPCDGCGKEHRDVKSCGKDERPDSTLLVFFSAYETKVRRIRRSVSNEVN